MIVPDVAAKTQILEANVRTVFTSSGHSTDTGI